MRWYEYKMETDDLYAPDDLKAKLLAMAGTLPEEEKNRPMMPAQADNTAVVRPQELPQKAKLIHFPAKQVGALAACLAVCVLGYSTLHLGIGMGSAKSSAPTLYAAEGSADSSAASVAAGGFDLQHAALDSTPEAVNDSLEADDRSLETEYSGTGSAEAAAPAVDSAKIIYTANLTLESKDYDAARAALDAALAEAGGYMESSDEYANSGSRRSLSLTLRVPQENYESFLAAVAATGNVTYKSQQAEDVTTQYMDIEARLDSLKEQRARLQELKASADNLSDLLQIESSLSDVQYQLESYQSQLDWYSRQVECCTVYLSLEEVQTYTPVEEGFGSRIQNALREGWSGFVETVQSAAVFLVGHWPFLVVGAVCGVIFYKARHPKHKKQK